jgi:Ca-activated chloride channel family protein
MTMRRQALRSREPLATFLFLSLLLVFLLTLIPILAKADPAGQPADAAPQAKTLNPGDMNTGSLLVQTEDGSFVEVPRLATDIETVVNGTIARTTVIQRFENPSDRWLEGVYVFPLPEQSAVDALRMEIGTRVIDGEIKAREEAKELYEAAKDAGYKASLVEQERPNIFTNSVANIGPKETVTIRIEYQETVKQDAGVYSLRFPLVVAPRYIPDPREVKLVSSDGKYVVTDPVPDRNRITPPVLDPDKAPKVNPVTIKVTLNAGFDLGDVTSAHHKIALNRSGDESATLTLADGVVPADKDFELVWKPKAASLPQTALFYETVGGSDYLLAMVTPPTLDAAPKLLPRELIFVIDNSGSMAGASIMQAKQSLLFALDRLRPGDKFNVIRFDDTMETLFDKAVDATSENLAVAKHFVSRLDAQGGTEMLPALKAALHDATPSDTSRVRQVVFLTDGAVGNEAELFKAISAELGRSRLFTVGIGSAPNSYFMRRAAETGRGTFTHIGSDAQVLERMRTLFAKLEKPVMVGLKASWPAGTSVEVWPDPLPDLYAGEPVVVSAKVSSRDGEMKLEGMFDGKPWSETIKLADAVAGKGTGKLWARSKIESLEGKLYSADANEAEVNKAVETVALEHHLVSSRTSLVAIDKNPTRPDGKDMTTVKVPLNLPDGWVYDKVFGPQPKAQHAMKAQPGSYGTAMAYRTAAPMPTPMPTPMASYDYDSSAAAAPAADVSPDPAQVPVLTAPPAEAEAQGETAQPDTTVQPSVQDAVQPAADAIKTGLAKQTALFALLLVILSAVTLVLWRYHRRDFASPRRNGRRI